MACLRPSLTLDWLQIVSAGRSGYLLVQPLPWQEAGSWLNNCSAVRFCPTIPYTIQKWTLSEELFRFYFPKKKLKLIYGF